MLVPKEKQARPNDAIVSHVVVKGFTPGLLPLRVG